MKTKIRTAHEETHSGEVNRIIGVLLNYDDNSGFRESYVYIYKQGMYIFFDTITDMINYLFYGEYNLKRAYMEEKVFDDFYDSQFINGKFGDHLTWVTE